MESAKKELDQIQKEESKSKLEFSQNYNKFQAMINRLNSKKFQKSNAKPKIIKDQQTLIDRLEKELEVSSIKEVNVKEQINEIEEKM